MADIFISYGRKNIREFTELICWLADENYDFWYDRQNLVASDLYREKIVDAIKSARATLVIWSREAVKSEWVRHEASTAYASGDAPPGNYVPLTVAGFDQGLVPDPLQGYHMVDVSDRNAIRKALEKKGVKPKGRRDQAINTAILSSGNGLPPAAVVSADQDPGGFIGRFRKLIWPGPNAYAQTNPLAGLFGAGPWTKHMPAKRTEFLNYEPDFLRTAYSRERTLLGQQPYSELVDFLQLAVGGVFPHIDLEIVPGTFSLGSWDGIGDEIVAAGTEKLVARGKVSNPDGPVIRVEDVFARDGRIVLKVQKARCLDQARSNLIADYAYGPPERQLSLRRLLSDQFGQSLPPLSDRRLANTLGVAAILFYRHEGIWTPALWSRATTDVAVFEGGWHCSSSGAAEWDDAATPTFHNLIFGDMLREIEEEVGIPRRKVVDLKPIAICREFARMGKPQLFFAGLVDLNQRQIREAAEAAQKLTVALGGPREMHVTSIYHYPRGVLVQMRKRQRGTPREQHGAAYFEVDTLFGKNGLTTECVANLYYASHALPFLDGRRRRT